MPLKIRPNTIEQEFGPFTFPGINILEGNLQISLRESEVVFNEGGADINVRFESSGNVNMLFVDTGNDRVGIGMNNPDYELDVAGDIRASAAMRTPLIYLSNEIYASSGSAADPSYTFSADQQSGLFLIVPGVLALSASGVEAFRLTATESRLGLPLKIKEIAAAVADTGGYGQLWVKNATPCELWFTDDAGLDTQIV